MNGSLDALQRIVGEWGERTFPDATLASIAEHLDEEAEELGALCAPQPPDEGMAETSAIAEEAADCLLLLLHLAHRAGFSLFDAARAKHGVNKQRTWGAPTGKHGYRKHVERTPS